MSKREEYIEKLKNKIDEWDKDIEQLEVKARQASEDMRHKWESRKLELEEKRADMQGRLERLRNSADDTWNDLKQEIDQAWDTLSKGIKDMKDKLLG